LAAEPINAGSSLMEGEQLRVARTALQRRQSTGDFVSAYRERAAQTGWRDLAAVVAVVHVFGQQVFQAIDLCRPSTLRAELLVSRDSGAFRCQGTSPFRSIHEQNGTYVLYWSIVFRHPDRSERSCGAVREALDYI
jgi:hypothetical protein